MPSRDPAKRREQMRRWRQANPDQIALYDATERPERVITEARRQQERVRQHNRSHGGSRTFVGCDGEGMGDGAAHDYFVFRMGDNLLMTGDPLTPDELLWFIASQDQDPIYTIFSGNYDFTMILRRLPREVVGDLLNRPAREREDGVVRPARWRDFALDYIPHKRLSVRVRGSGPIIIHDVFGFLQCSFMDAISKWNIGTEEERRKVAEGKLRRGDSNVLSAEELEYNRIECKLLAELVKEMDDTASALGITMAPYEGAGALANSLLRVHVSNPIKRKNKELPPEKQEAVFASELDPAVNLDTPSWDAYYGGRFEITAHGPIDRPVYEYDINSAYPSIIRKLPCLQHGKWIHHQGPFERHDKYRDGRPHYTLGHLRWEVDPYLPYGPLPHRNKQGNVTFPLRGSGWYWQIEWPADRSTYTVDDCWTFVPQCDEKPFWWVYDRFQQRRAHKAAGRFGHAEELKYGYNSLYGKFVQSVGKAKWRNSVYGGLITAGTRAQLREAADQSPGDIIMFATDGLYSLKPLSLDLGNDLGQWEANVYEDGLWLVRPGIYFSPDGEAKIKTRGIGRATVQRYAGAIKAAFSQVYDHPEWLTSLTGSGIEKWGVDIEYNGLVSVRLAHSQNRPERAGYFGTLPHRMSYNIGPKRVPYAFEDFDANWVDGILRSAAPPVGYPFESVGYRKGALPSVEEDDELDLVNSAPDKESGEQLELFG